MPTAELTEVKLPIFSTAGLEFVSGATARQLQWWDEHGIAVARHVGKRRQYDFDQALLAMICQHLRRAGLSCQRVRSLTMGIIKDHRVKNAIETDSELFLLVGKNVHFAMSEHAAVRDMVSRAEPFLVIAIHEYIGALKACKEAMTARRM